MMATVGIRRSHQMVFNSIALWTRSFSSLYFPKINPSVKVGRKPDTPMIKQLSLNRLAVPRTTCLVPSFNQSKHHSSFSTSTKKIAMMKEEDLKKKLDEFQDLFTEARLCIEDAEDAMETTYFDEEAETAKEAVSVACAAYTEIIEELLGGDGDQDRANLVRRSNGLKVEQLKGELELTLTGGHH